jgi:hypothetical protein
MSATSNSTEDATPSGQCEPNALDARRQWMVNLVCAILDRGDSIPSVGNKGDKSRLT